VQLETTGQQLKDDVKPLPGETDEMHKTQMTLSNSCVTATLSSTADSVTWNFDERRRLGGALDRQSVVGHHLGRHVTPLDLSMTSSSSVMTPRHADVMAAYGDLHRRLYDKRDASR